MDSTKSSPWCLVLEDQVLIGMALEISLEEAGFRVAGPFMSNTEALTWLDGHTPDIALVDVLLKDGPCTGVVQALRKREIPFAIYSGLRPSTRPPELAAVPWMEKPVSREDLTRALRDLVGADREQGGANTPRVGEALPEAELASGRLVPSSSSALEFKNRCHRHMV